MNTVALTLNPETDYRAAMQQAAVAFLFAGRACISPATSRC